MLKKIGLMIALSFLLSGPVFGCRVSSDERYTFLKSLPILALDRPMVAQIRVVGKTTRLGDATSMFAGVPVDYYEVKVIRNIKGTTLSQHFEIAHVAHSCNRDGPIIRGSKWFVAGQFPNAPLTDEWLAKDVFGPQLPLAPHSN
jgi:hypothetical protein